MSQDADIGRRVLAALARGRELQLLERRQQAAQLRELVLRASRLDRAAGRPDRGRAARVARRLQLSGVEISERWARQIISEVSDTDSASAA